MAGRRGKGRGRSQNQGSNKVQNKGRGRSKKNLDLIENNTINDETSNVKRKRSIVSNSDSSDDEENQKEKLPSSQPPLLEQNNTGPFYLSLTTPILQKNTTPTPVSIPKSLFSSTQFKNTKNNSNSLICIDDEFEENNGNQTDNSIESSQVSTNKNNSTLLHDANTSIFIS